MDIIPGEKNLEPMQNKFKVSQKGIRFMGPKLYNKLPLECQEMTYKRFGKKLKKFLLE